LNSPIVSNFREKNKNLFVTKHLNLGSNIYDTGSIIIKEDKEAIKNGNTH